MGLLYVTSERKCWRFCRQTTVLLLEMLSFLKTHHFVMSINFTNRNVEGKMFNLIKYSFCILSNFPRNVSLGVNDRNLTACVVCPNKEGSGLRFINTCHNYVEFCHSSVVRIGLIISNRQLTLCYGIVCFRRLMSALNSGWAFAFNDVIIKWPLDYKYVAFRSLFYG